ncbi:MAG: 3'-5' exonuclease [Pirellulaceae bacterium]
MAKGETKRTVSQLASNTVEELYGFFLDSPSEAWARLPDLNPLSDEQIDEIVSQLREYTTESKSIQNAIVKDVAQFEEGDLEALLKKGLGKPILAGETKYNRAEIPADLVALYRRLGQHLAALRIKEHRQHLAAARALLDSFHGHFSQLKRSARGMEFSDVTRAIDLGWERVRRLGADDREETPLRHWLLDEFQDTNPAQWRSLEPQVTTALKHDGSLMVVGDTKQAIYGWRGGDARLFDSVEQLCQDDRTVLTLDVSRRSAQAVLDAVNQIFHYARDTDDWEDHADGARAWTAGFIEHRSAFKQRAGYACLEGAADPLDRAVEIAQELYSRTAHCSIAILVRNNDKVGTLIEKLTRAGVPASEEAGKSIADSPTIQIVLSALHLIDHPADSVARFHLAATPLGLAWGLVPEPEGSDSNQGRIPAIAARQRELLIEQGYGPTIETWAQALIRPDDARERQRLEQLIDLAFHFEPRATLRPSDFARYIETTKVSDPSSERVRVMNFHQSKGLEFDAVIVPDLDRHWIGQRPSFVAHRPQVTSLIGAIGPYVSREFRSLFPPDMVEWTTRWEAEQIGENMSMFYVAMTRAARALYLVSKPCKADARLTKWSSLIVHALRPGEPILEGLRTYEHGDPQWFESAEAELSALDSAPSDERELHPSPINLTSGEPRLGRNLRRASPSSREGGFRIRVSDLFKQGNPAALARGTAIHALFELIRWLDADAAPSPESLQQCLDRLEETPRDSQRIIDQFTRMLERPATAELLNEQAQLSWARDRWPRLGSDISAEVSNEHRFVFFEPATDGLQLCSGSIDRLVRFQGSQGAAAAIIDYKTDSVDLADPSSLSDRVSHYRPQLLAYRDAVARLLKLSPDQIAARLVFVEIDKVVDVAD